MDSLTQTLLTKVEPESYLDILRRRRRAVTHAVASSIPDADRRLYPHFNEERAEIYWAQIKLDDWTDDERLTLQWMKAMLTGRLSIPSRDPLNLLPMNSEMKEAIICALAIFTYSSHVINDYYRKIYSGDRRGITADHKA
jgi:hypothetical protein